LGRMYIDSALESNRLFSKHCISFLRSCPVVSQTALTSIETALIFI
jgi:hypothetical protein